MANKFRQARSDLQKYALECEETGKELGRGSYATVIELQFKGLKCAGKKIHRVLYNQQIENLITRFGDECKLISELRHPNIIQFLGVYFEHDNVPVLVMEYLHTTLAQCLDQYGIMPLEICYSILTDIVLGLRYLHEKTPPIIHRDLSANNVLLTENFTAKISDLGVAKIANVPIAMASRMTAVPGTPCYMPPEALVPNPRYNIKIDIFSYGILIIHIFSGTWPLPTEATILDPSNTSRLIPVQESDRRQQYLEIMGTSHPLIDLTRACLENNSTLRPEAFEIWKRVKEVVSQYQPTYPSKLEMFLKLIGNSSSTSTEITTSSMTHTTPPATTSISTRITNSSLKIPTTTPAAIATTSSATNTPPTTTNTPSLSVTKKKIPPQTPQRKTSTLSGHGMKPIAESDERTTPTKVVSSRNRDSLGPEEKTKEEMQGERKSATMGSSGGGILKMIEQLNENKKPTKGPEEKKQVREMERVTKPPEEKKQMAWPPEEKKQVAKQPEEKKQMAWPPEEKKQMAKPPEEKKQYREMAKPPEEKKQVSEMEKEAETKVLAEVMYDFNARDEEELSITKGEVVELLDREDQSNTAQWWLVQKGDLIGTIPSNYAKIITTKKIDNTRKQSKPQEKPPASQHQLETRSSSSYDPAGFTRNKKNQSEREKPSQSAQPPSETLSSSYDASEQSRSSLYDPFKQSKKNPPSGRERPVQPPSQDSYDPPSFMRNRNNSSVQDRIKNLHRGTGKEEPLPKEYTNWRAPPPVTSKRESVIIDNTEFSKRRKQMEQMFGGGGGSVSQTPALELPPREPVENIAAPPTPVYVANFNYTAEDEDEVSFSKGDEAVEAMIVGEGWMEGRIRRTGQYGMMPSNYFIRK